MMQLEVFLAIEARQWPSGDNRLCPSPAQSKTRFWSSILSRSVKLPFQLENVLPKNCDTIRDGGQPIFSIFTRMFARRESPDQTIYP